MGFENKILDESGEDRTGMLKRIYEFAKGLE